MTPTPSYNPVGHVYPNPRNGVNVGHQMFPSSNPALYPYGHFYNSHNMPEHGDQLQITWQNHSFGPYPNWGPNIAEAPQAPANFIQHPNPNPFGVNASPNNSAPHIANRVNASPAITVSGSDASSPSGVGAYSPVGARPGPDRTPFKWMETTQAQPAQVTELSSAMALLDFAPLDAGKTRTKDKYRVVYSDNQRLELEKEFHFSKYITIRRKSELAATLSLSERQVKIWFQNRRAKERKQSKKSIMQDKDKLGLHMDHTHQLQHSLHQMNLNSGTLHALQHGINPHPIVTAMGSPPQNQGTLHPSNLGPGIM